MEFNARERAWNTTSRQPEFQEDDDEDIEDNDKDIEHDDEDIEDDDEDIVMIWRWVSVPDDFLFTIWWFPLLNYWSTKRSIDDGSDSDDDSNDDYDDDDDDPDDEDDDE